MIPVTLILVVTKLYLQRGKNYWKRIFRCSFQGDNRRNRRNCCNQKSFPRQKIQKQRVDNSQNAAPPQLRRDEIVILHQRRQTG